MKNKETFAEVTVTYPILMEDIRSLLVSALEGGSNYWMELNDLEYPPNTTKEDFIEGGKYAVKNYHPAYVLPFIKDGAIVIQDLDEVTHTLTKGKIEEGLRIMARKYPQHFRDFISEDYDGNTHCRLKPRQGTAADIFLQLALFGDIMYG